MALAIVLGIISLSLSAINSEQTWSLIRVVSGKMGLEENGSFGGAF